MFGFCLSSGRREPLKRCRLEGKYDFYQHGLIGLADVIVTLVAARTAGPTLPVWASRDKVVFMQCAELRGRNIVEQ